MRIIKLALLSFIFLAVVVTIISIFIPSHIRISRNVRINSAREVVMAQISDPVKWKNWYPGADSLELLLVNGEVKGIKLDNLQGFVTITDKNDSSVVAVTSGSGIREIVTGWNIIPENDPDKITVQWYMDFHIRWYPWEKFRSLLFERSYGSQMDEGLDKLKRIVESGRSSNN